jgi:hypothetical protein
MVAIDANCPISVQLGEIAVRMISAANSNSRPSSSHTPNRLQTSLRRLGVVALRLRSRLRHGLPRPHAGRNKHQTEPRGTVSFAKSMRTVHPHDCDRSFGAIVGRLR